LVAVVAQTLETRNDRRILKVRSLLVTGEDGPSIREKIRAGHIAQLDQDIDNQLKRDLWG
ncbi:twitching motility protein PilT, partial [Pseudomonas sp. Snoq117.2]